MYSLDVDAITNSGSGDTFFMNSALLNVGSRGSFFCDLRADIRPVPSQDVVFRRTDGDQTVKDRFVRRICCRSQAKTCDFRPPDEKKTVLPSVLDPPRHLVKVRSDLCRAQHYWPGEALEITARSTEYTS
jgi:hypothetical protein